MEKKADTININVTALYVVVEGRVQGVGFRAFVWEAAHRLGLRGYVRNLPDGTVETLVCGEREALGELLRSLHSGPAGSHVTGVKHDWLGEAPSDMPTGFEVRH